MNLTESFLTLNPCYHANASGADDRYTTFQRRGPLGLVLHSVGVAQPSAQVFTKRWNSPSYDRACVHAFIDADTGAVYQCLPWNYRAWHVGGSANNTHVGVEMCEPSAIKYTTGAKFTITDKDKAFKQCETAYKAAVELFAYLCKKYSLDPLKDGVILSHNECGKRGIGSGHVDPEHLWTGLGIGYTMAGFRKDVKAAMSGVKVEPTTQPAAPVAEKTLTVKVRQLQRGMEGGDVRTLQAALIANGFSCGSAGTDGDFGAGTEAALKKFQTKYSLGADGIAGNGTWGKLLGK